MSLFSTYNVSFIVSIMWDVYVRLIIESASSLTQKQILLDALELVGAVNMLGKAQGLDWLIFDR